MAVTDDQYAAMLTRITAIERRLNQFAVAIDKFVTLSQVNGLVVSLTTDIADLRTDVEAMDARVTGLEVDPET